MIIDPDAPSLGFVIQELFVFALVAADKTRLDSLRKYAQALAREGDRGVKLVRFTAREEMETIKP